jgi:ABC-type transport system involved in multi-copper enzyme maturation permease subunit
VTRYLTGELYRLVHKRSLYIYLVVLAALYAAAVFMRGANVGPTTLASDAGSLITWLPLLLGGFLFATVCTDELGCKALTAMVGYGLGKARIVVAKVLLMALASAVLLALVPLFMTGVLTAFGAAPAAGSLGGVYAYALKAWMLTVAYSAVAAIVAYASQRSTFAVVAYLFLAVGVVSAIVGLALGSDAVAAVLPGASDLMAASISDHARDALLVGDYASTAVALAQWAVYTVVASAIAAIVFKRREMEF